MQLPNGRFRATRVGYTFKLHHCNIAQATVIFDTFANKVVFNSIYFMNRIFDKVMGILGKQKKLIKRTNYYFVRVCVFRQ